MQAECGFGLRTAENYIRAPRFAWGKTKCVSFLNPATVYRLPAKSAPPEIVQTVLDRAAKGEVISDGEVVAALEWASFQKREAERRQEVSTRRVQSKKARERDERTRAHNENCQRQEDERYRLVSGITDPRNRL